MSDDTELDDDLVAVVLAEALESLESALWTLRALDYGPRGLEVVASLFRCFHSIKGNTAMAGRTAVSQFAHRVESVMDVIRGQNRVLRPVEGALLIEIVDLMHPLIEQAVPAADALGAALSALVRFESLHVVAAVPAASPSLHTGSRTRVEIESGGPPFSDDARQAPPSSNLLERTESETEAGTSANKLRVEVQSIIDTMMVAGELFQIDERLKFLVRLVDSDAALKQQDASDRWEGLHQISREFDAAIERLYAQLLDIQRLPVSQITGPLERIVRDICRKTGKEIDLIVIGKELRIDKQVSQVLKDPLMHMVRNACDHGVELPAARIAAGKPPRATVSLEFHDAEDSVVVTLGDNGRGLDLVRIREKAVQKRLVSAADAKTLSEQQIIQFVFHPGFSTADQVSELSGRGVGMDVVANSISGAGGVLQTSTEQGKGTQFRIELAKLGSPVVDGLAVRSCGVVFLIPLKNVLCFIGRSGFRVIREPSGVLSALVQGRTYALSRLPGETDASSLRNPRTIGVLVEDRRGKRAVVIVDEVLGRRKALAQEVRYEPCQRVREMGVAILGDGSIGFTIAVEELANHSLLLLDREGVSLEIHPENEGLRCAS